MNGKLKHLTTIALLSAMAYVVVALCRIPVVLFLSYEPKDIIITLGGLIWGPLTSCIVSVLVSFFEMITISETGIWGFIMNVLSTCSFACTAAFIYKKKRSLTGAVIGLLAGAVTMIGIMLLWNFLITPIYMGYPRQAIAELLIPVFLPFNALKAGLNAAFTFLLYRPIISALRKTGYIQNKTNQQKKKAPVGLILIAAGIIITCVLWILSMNGII